MRIEHVNPARMPWGKAIRLLRMLLLLLVALVIVSLVLAYVLMVPLLLFWVAHASQAPVPPLEIGMRKQEVINIVGPPREKKTLPPAVYENFGVECWNYTIWKDMQVFYVYFDADGKVKQIGHSGWFQ